MNKQLIMITAPFNCGYCDENGFELIEMQNENKADEDLPVDVYPTIMFRVNEEIKSTLTGYNKQNILKELKKH